MKSKKNSLVVPDTGSPVNLYRGRFAPSPSGPLHIGSLVAALASYLDARANGGQWLVRIEDLDPPREEPGATRLILKTLENLGLHWDGSVLYQSTRHEAYAAALQELQKKNTLYLCQCSRQQIAGKQGVYPGTCRTLNLEPGARRAVRCKVQHRQVCFKDRYQGELCQWLSTECGDFVVLRKDGYFAYQLAVVVDDAWQGITDVVRGIDLIDSTPRQIYLQSLLDLPALRYAHLPVIVDSSGSKLSKQQHARPLDPDQPQTTLLLGLEYLQQNPPPALAGSTVADILQWATNNWQPNRFEGLQSICLFDDKSNAAV